MASDSELDPPVAYTVFVDDNFHYPDPEHRWAISGFVTAEEALQKCRSIVDACLAECAEPGATAEQIFGCYRSFGDDPWISGPDVQFSAWEYAEENAHRFVR